MKKKAVLLAVGVLVAAGIFFYTGQRIMNSESTKERVIGEHVRIGQWNVSGMTSADAKALLNRKIEQYKTESLVLTGNGKTLEINLGELNLSAQVDSAVRKAMEISGQNIPLEFSIDTHVLSEQMECRQAEMTTAPTDGRVKKVGDRFEYTAGIPGTRIDIAASVTMVTETLEQYLTEEAGERQSIPLVMEEIAPRGTGEELALIKDVLGSYQTNYGSSEEERKKNISNGCAKINGTLLYPGDTFSVYEVTAPFTEENGYGVGGAYENGQLVDSVGGGICQVSTTLYNAVLRAELKVTFRASHSMTVSYVDISADAAIAGTYKDFCFRNDYDYPVYIEGIAENGQLTFRIYGCETRASNRTIKFVSKILSTEEPKEEYLLSQEMEVGSYEVTENGKSGYHAQLWKEIYLDGVKTEEIRVNKSEYDPAPTEITIGIKGATEEQLAAIEEAVATGDWENIKNTVEAVTGQ